MSSNGTIIATAAISGTVAVLVGGLGAFTTTHVANVETSRKILEYSLKRRSERQETYKTAIDLLTDWLWRRDDRKYDVVHEFTIPFVRSANHVRIYGSPASVAAEKAIRLAIDHFVIAARADVGPRAEDDLKEVPFHQGAGPPAL